MEDLAQKREDLTHRTFLLMFRVLLIFGVPAAVGYFIGKWLDTTYSIRPYGTLGVLALTFIGSWIAVIRIYIKVDRAFRELRMKEEAQERQQSQKK